MGKFVLTAQLNLQGPKNTTQIADQIKRQLGGVAVNVQVKNSAAAVRDLKRVSDATNDANEAVNKLGDAFGVSLKRFAAFSLASRAIGLFTRKLAGAIDEAIEFDLALTRISQVTGDSRAELSGLNKEISRLATTWGVASKEIASVALTLAQAGLSAKDTKVALEALTKTSLSATFDDINETTEGAVALMAQFGEGAEALERQLSQVNTVAAKFAVESSDLIEVVRRTGGVFKSSGGQLEELLALFTSVRATTRENTESIATGLRNVFSRIQNPTTLTYLEKLGISLTEVDEVGRKVFVGPFEAIKRLNAALKDTKPGDVKFIEIAKQLGGTLQIGKVIPLIQQFEVAERARQAALENGDSLTKDAITAQEALAVQLTKVREEFAKLIREVTQTQSFQILTKSVLGFASALVDVADALKPVLPLIGAFAAFKLVKGAGGFLGGVGSALTRRNKGGPIGFASGGLVPGSGNRDTVPAMLSPGEFVIRKSSVQKMGAGNLHKMNKYAAGGEIKLRDGAIGGFFLNPENAQDTIKRVKSRTVDITNPDFLRQAGGIGGKKGPVSQQKLAQFGAGLSELERNQLGITLSPATRSQKDKAAAISNKLRGQPDLVAKLSERYSQGLRNNELSAIKGDVPQFKITGGLAAMFPGKDELSRGPISKAVSEQTEAGLKNIIKSTIEQIRPLINVAPLDASENTAYNEAIKNLFSKGGSAQETIEGYINEGLISGITGAKLGGTGSTFDFDKASLNASRGKLGQLFGTGNIGSLVKADAKRSVTESTLKSLYDKVAADINKGQFSPGDGIEKIIPAKFQDGGKVDFKAMRLIDDITSNADGAKVPSPKNLARILQAKTAALDVDRTLFRTLGDKAYANAKTAKAKEEVLRRFFLNPSTRLNDIKSAPLTGFGSQLLGAIKDGQVDPRNLSIISKSHPVSGLAEYISQIFGIPTKNMRFTSGGDKQALLEQMRKFGPGGGIRKKFAKGGASTDTVPALLTPGEFVMSKKASQHIGYGNLHKMNRGGVQGYAKGGVVGSDAKRGGFEVGSVGVLIGLSTLSGIVDQIIGETTETNKMFKMFNSAISSGAIAFITFNGLLKQLGDTSLLARIEAKENAKLAQDEENVQKEAKQFNEEQEQKKKQQAELMAANKQKISDIKSGKTSITGGGRSPDGAGALGATMAMNRIRESNSVLDKIRNNITKKTASQYYNQPTDEFRKAQELAVGDFEMRAANKKRQGMIAAERAAMSPLERNVKDFGKKFTQAYRTLDQAVQSASTGVANGVQKAGSVVSGSLRYLGSKVVDSAKYVNAKFGGLATALTSGAVAVGFAASSLLNSIKENLETELEKATERLDFSGAKITINQKLVTDELSNSLSAALTGAGLGAALGTLLAGPVGGLVGALAGGAGGLAFSGAFDSKAAKDKKRLERRQVAETAIAKKFSEQFASSQDKRLNQFEKGEKGRFGGAEGAAKFIKDTRDESRNALEAARSANVNKEARLDAEENIKSKLLSSATVLGQRANSEEELLKQVEALSGGMSEFYNELKNAALASKAATDVQKELTKANIDGLKLSSVFGAASLSVETMLGRFDDGVTELDSIIATIEAAQQNMLLGAEGRAAIEKARKAVFDSINDDPENIATEAGKSLSRQFTNLTAFNDFNEAVGKVVSELDTTTDLPGQRAQLQQAISNVVGAFGDEETRKKVEDNIDKIFTANPEATIDEVIKKIQESIGTLSEPIKKVFVTLNTQNKVLDDLTRKRIEMETKYLDAQRQAIDLQIEAGRTIEEFGGDKFTPLKELSAIAKRFNIIAANAGLSSIKGGAGDIRNVGAQINAAFSQLSGRALSGLAGGPELSIEENARQDKLRQANTALIEFTKQRIDLYKRELDIVQKKNDLEKSGLEKLVGGDVEGFISDTAASAAASAFRSGAIGNLKGLFSASTLAEAFKKVQSETNVTDATKNAVARATLGAFGINDPRAAGILSGTTDEELRLKRGARQTASTLGGLGQNAAEFGRLDVQAREVIFTNASVTFQSERAAAARRLNRGGIVYANKGIFVPRGTDTVPAMLTPGEFVVRREAVQAGNNLQILKAMNANAQSIAKATPQHMSNGGSVQYLELGGVASLNDFNAGFGANIDRLKNTNVNMQMAPATVVATLNAEALRAMSEQMQGNIIDAVISKLTQMKFNTAGEPTFRNTVLPNA